MKYKIGDIIMIKDISGKNEENNTVIITKILETQNLYNVVGVFYHQYEKTYSLISGSIQEETISENKPTKENINELFNAKINPNKWNYDDYEIYKELKLIHDRKRKITKLKN